MIFLFRYLDTIDSDTGELNTMSALNLIVFGPKLAHLDLIGNGYVFHSKVDMISIFEFVFFTFLEYVVVDLLKVKWTSFVRREFFIQMGIFGLFFAMGMTFTQKEYFDIF